MKNFQKIVAQIARKNGTTPEEVLREMQAAIDAAYANPSAEEKIVQNAIPSRGGPSHPRGIGVPYCVPAWGQFPLTESLDALSASL